MRPHTIITSSTNLDNSVSIDLDRNIFPTNIKIKYRNINGLGDKLGESDMIEDITSRHITILAEAMKGPSFSYDLPGFTVKSYPHSTHEKCKRRTPGGFVLITKNTIGKYVNVVKQNDHVLWLKISCIKGNMSAFIPAVYMPHEHSVLHNQEIEEFQSLLKDVEKYQSQGVIIPVGDFNARTADAKDYQIITQDTDYTFTNPTVITPRTNIDEKLNKQGKKLLEFCKITGLQIQNGRLNNQDTYTCYRHNGQSTVDYLLADKEGLRLISDFRIQPRDVNSDHCALTFSIATNKNTDEKPTKPANTQNKNVKRYRWDKARIRKYHDELKSPAAKTKSDDFVCNIASQDLTHSQIIDSFYDVVMPPIEKTFQEIIYKPNTKFPRNNWFDEDCKNAKRLANDALKIDPWSVEADILKKDFQRITQQKKRKYRKENAKNVHKIQSSDPQDYWNFWKSFADSKGQTDILEVSDFTNYYKTVATNHLTANDDNYDHKFMEVIEDLIGKIDPQKEIETYKDNAISDCLNAPITSEEVQSALKNVKNKKAAGSDGLICEFFKYSDNQLDNPLVALFNYVFSSGEYPDLWSNGIINPIHKKDSKSDPGNYRKITVMPALGKIFDSIMNSRLSSIKDILELNDPLQFGFKKKHGSVDNAFILNSIIDINNARKKSTYVCYIDLKSAFDMIIRAALMLKLRKQGVKGKFFAVLKNMFSKAKSSVKWNGVLGETFDNICGVLQGGVSSPQLFKIFLEDLVKYLDTSCGVKINGEMIAHLLLADDLALISETKGGLQRLLDGFSQFCKRWHLVVNMDKTKYSIYNKKHSLPSNLKHLTYNGMPVKEVSEYTYVGLIFSTEKQRFNKHIENVATNANKAIFAAMSLAHKAMGSYPTAKTHLHIFETQIRPILEYAMPVWYNTNGYSLLEKLHTTYLKRALGVGKHTPHLALYGETNTYPLHIRQQYFFLKYWLRLAIMPKGSILHNIYKEHINNNTDFISKIKTTLQSAGLPLIGEIPEIQATDTTTILKLIKYNLENIFKTTWLHSINDSEKHPMLRTYKLFKTEFKREPYIDQIDDRQIQKSISKFRLSSHCLRIHTGRFENIEAKDRICKACNIHEIDNEEHFLLNCTFHTDRRNTLLSDIRNHIPLHMHNTQIFSNILNSDNPKIIHSLGNFLYTGFKKRRSLIFNQ